jgi:hypothetical protein
MFALMGHALMASAKVMPTVNEQRRVVCWTQDFLFKTKDSEGHARQIMTVQLDANGEHTHPFNFMTDVLKSSHLPLDILDLH